MMKLLTVVAVAAMGLTACQTGFEEQANVNNNVTVSFVAEQTRTAVDTSGSAPLFSWSDNETFAVLEQTDALAQATSVTYAKVDGKAKIDAQFPINADKGEYKYIAIYPASGYTAAENISNATLALPSAQSMAEGSYDPDADLMVSWPVVTAAQPTEAQSLRFTRLVAVAKMTINNLNLAEGEVVEKVEFAADGKALAGSIAANLENPHEFTVSEGVSSIAVATNSASDVYFTTLPATLAAGDAYSVVVTTNQNTYTKDGVIPAEKSLVFEVGNVSRFSVNMADAVAVEKWELVYDSSSLKQGDVVAIVAKDYDLALSTKLYNNAAETSTSAKRDKTEITKVGDSLISNSDVQQLILVDGVVAGTFSLYDEARQKFLVSTSTSSTYLINRAYCDEDTSFAITIDNTTAIATITNIEGDYAGNMLRYNSNGYFVSNKNTSTTYKDVCIYRRGGVVGEIPVVAANVTVPESDEQVVIAEEGAQSATAIEDVVFNYVGDWTISATSDAQWLTLAYDKANNCLTYTAEANSGAVRTAVATITATLEGQQPLSWTFNVLQKGAPVEISIADFVTKGQDVNTTYKLTGILAEIPSSSSASAAFKIQDQDGVQATIKYLYTDQGELVKGNVDLQLGDVITVTTVVTSSTKGSGGSSTYPSVYKGYYRLNATADSALVGYEGGDVTISVAAEGNLLPADGVIKGAMAEAYDFVTLNYTDNAATATATFAQNSGSSRNAEFSFTYGLAAASVSVGQMNHPSVKVGWFLVTSLSELAVGDKVIIAGKSPDGTADYAISSASSTGTFRPAAAITLLGNSITSVDGLQQYTLESGHADCPDTWAFKGDSDGKYLYYSSGLKVTSTLNASGSWTIAIAEDGKATLTSQTTASKNTMMLNYTTSNQTFSMYEPTQADKGAIYLYKEYK